MNIAKTYVYLNKLLNDPLGYINYHNEIDERKEYINATNEVNSLLNYMKENNLKFSDEGSGNDFFEDDVENYDLGQYDEGATITHTSSLTAKPVDKEKLFKYREELNLYFEEVKKFFVQAFEEIQSVTEKKELYDINEHLQKTSEKIEGKLEKTKKKLIKSTTLIEKNFQKVQNSIRRKIAEIKLNSELNKNLYDCMKILKVNIPNRLSEVEKKVSFGKKKTDDLVYILTPITDKPKKEIEFVKKKIKDYRKAIMRKKRIELFRMKNEDLNKELRKLKKKDPNFKFSRRKYNQPNIRKVIFEKIEYDKKSVNSDISKKLRLTLSTLKSKKQCEENKSVNVNSFKDRIITMNNHN